MIRCCIAAILSCAIAPDTTAATGFISLADPTAVPDWFPFEVSKIDVTSPGILRFDQLGSVTEVRAIPGTAFRVGETTFSVMGERPWSGLLRNENGSSMAMIRWGNSANGEGARVALTDRVWVRFDENVAMRLEWHESAGEAETALASALPQLESAQWGIVEGGVTQWFTSFAPGTGAILKDGTRATLVEFVDSFVDDALGRPAVRVRFDREGQREEEWCIGEADRKGARVQFECPASRPVVVRVAAWAEGSARLGVSVGGTLADSGILDADIPWQVPGTEHELSIEQVLANAFYIAPEQSPWKEAVVRNARATIDVREGEAVREGDALLSYIRKEDARRIAMTLRRADGSETVATLDGGREIEIADGERRFRLRFESRDSGDGIRVEELMDSERFSPALVFCMALVLVAFAGIASAANWKRRLQRSR